MKRKGKRGSRIDTSKVILIRSTISDNLLIFGRVNSDYWMPVDACELDDYEDITSLFEMQIMSDYNNRDEVL